MALGDLMAASRFSQSTTAVSNHLEEFTENGNHVEEDGERSVYSSNSIVNSNNNSNARDLTDTASSSYTAMTTTTSMAYLPQTVVLCELRHDGFEDCMPSGPSDSGLVSRWRPRDRVSSRITCLYICIIRPVEFIGQVFHAIDIANPECFQFPSYKCFQSARTGLMIAIWGLYMLLCRVVGKYCVIADMMLQL